MAHFDQNFMAMDAAQDVADAFYSADIVALNSSGASGNVLFAVDMDSEMLHVAVNASGLTPNQTHVQHIHGTFGSDGTPNNAMTPTLANDMDGDGYVEVLEGLTSYGDILLSLTGSDGMPVADSEGNISFYASYDITDPGNFLSPVTNTQYSFDDIMELALREYVVHGVQVPDGAGTGTGGEVNGMGGYVPILPAGASEITTISQMQASAQLDQQALDAGLLYQLSGSDDVLDAGAGMDTVQAGRGEDTIMGGAGGDELFGLADNDMLDGGEGDDLVNGGSGDDMLSGGAGDDTVLGGAGDDIASGGLGDDLVLGSAGNDTLTGGSGADSLLGGNEDDVLEGGSGNDLLAGGSGGDRIFGGDGGDWLSGGAGDDLLVGGADIDVIFGGSGDDIIGGLGGNDRTTGGAGADEFHFDAGTGRDFIRDFTQGEDVISFLDGGAITFANSTEDMVRGDSDLNAADFDTIANLSEMDMTNDQQVLVSNGTAMDAEMSAGAAVEAYLSASDGTNTYIYYDDDWSTLENREMIAQVDNVTAPLTLSDFDVY